MGDVVFGGAGEGGGVLVLVLLGAIIVSLLVGGWPSFRAFGVGFLFDAEWDPVQNVFGRGADLWHAGDGGVGDRDGGAVGVRDRVLSDGIGAAWFRRPVGTAIESLAAVPSIIYGMWGFFLIVPFMAEWVQPPLIEWLGDLPLVGAVRGAAVRDGDFHGGVDIGGDDPAVHRGDDAGCVSHGAGGFQGVPLTGSGARRGR
jgi:phosphate transport system permease protein